MGKSFKNIVSTIRSDYFEWRYWGNLKSNMEKQIKNYSNVPSPALLIPYINKPGIAFSFDDSFRINDWYEYGKEIFGYYDVKVTFNINGHHHFEGQREHTQSEIDKLLELQSNGHEIAHHGFKHRNAAKYSDEVGMSRWLEDEIISLFKWMDKQSHSMTGDKFRKLVSYALPYTEYNNEIIDELVPKYFKIVRGHLFKDNLTSFNHSGITPSICIDIPYLSNINYIKKIMKIAKVTGRNLILMCHSILPEEISWEDFGWGDDNAGVSWWRTSPNTLKEIINEARMYGMEFYRTSEIAGVATFIDPSFEKTVREILKTNEQWVTISDLTIIKELDLSDKNVTNLDGIQYFLNLEKITLDKLNVTNYRLLEKLPKLKDIYVKNEYLKNKKMNFDMPDSLC